MGKKFRITIYLGIKYTMSLTNAQLADLFQRGKLPEWVYDKFETVYRKLLEFLGGSNFLCRRNLFSRTFPSLDVAVLEQIVRDNALVSSQRKDWGNLFSDLRECVVGVLNFIINPYSVNLDSHEGNVRLTWLLAFVLHEPYMKDDESYDEFRESVNSYLLDELDEYCRMKEVERDNARMLDRKHNHKLIWVLEQQRAAQSQRVGVPESSVHSEIKRLEGLTRMDEAERKWYDNLRPLSKMEDPRRAKFLEKLQNYKVMREPYELQKYGVSGCYPIPTFSA